MEQESSMQDYHQLDIWNRAMDYAVVIYQLAATLPEEEKYNLASQLRRAVTSVPLNIAEGCGTASNPEFARFLGFAYRSLKEVVTCLELCQRLYPAWSRARVSSLIDEGNEISKMTYNLMQKVDPKTNPR
jgi:four helix bundle protein